MHRGGETLGEGRSAGIRKTEELWGRLQVGAPYNRSREEEDLTAVSAEIP